VFFSNRICILHRSGFYVVKTCFNWLVAAAGALRNWNSPQFAELMPTGKKTLPFPSGGIKVTDRGSAVAVISGAWIRQKYKTHKE